MQNNSEIQVVILAGGLGTRLKSVVSDKPKVLAEVLNRPFLTYILDQVSSAGFREVVLCTGFKAEHIKKKLGETYGPLRILHSTEEQPLGTGGALRLALPYLWSDIVLVMNGDSYIDVDLDAYVDWFFRKSTGDAAIVLTKLPDTTRYGSVVIDQDEHIIAFDEKTRSRDVEWINAGIYLMKKTLIAAIPAGRIHSLEREFFPLLTGKKLLGFRVKGRFIDIGIPASYAEAQEFFALKCS
jgi:D-glycero-alpha-D-manno-heptose 1-phosphate guanylyltransferase